MHETMLGLGTRCFLPSALGPSLMLWQLATAFDITPTFGGMYFEQCRRGFSSHECETLPGPSGRAEEAGQENEQLKQELRKKRKQNTKDKAVITYLGRATPSAGRLEQELPESASPGLYYLPLQLQYGRKR